MTKFFLILLSVLTSVPTFGQSSLPKSVACLTADFDSAGTIEWISSNGPQIAVLNFANETMSLFTLNSPWALYRPMYNLKSPIKLSLLNPYFSAGKYRALENAITSEWVLREEGGVRMVAKVRVNLSSLNGHISTEEYTNGVFSGSTQGDVVCTLAGVVP